MIIRLLLVTSLFCCVSNDAYKILMVSPLFGHSHAKFLGILADKLTDAGHNVTVLVPVLDKDLENKKVHKTTKDIRKIPVTENVLQYEHSLKNVMNKDLWTIKADASALVKVAENMSHLFEALCEDLATNETLLTELRNEKYDIGLAEPFYFCAFGIFETLGLPVTLAAESNVQMDYVSRYIGEPLAPSYVPGTLNPFRENMSFFQRIENAFGTVMGMNFFDGVLNAERKSFLKKDKNFRSVADIINDASYVFTNSNPYLNFDRPIGHKTIEIGGITIDTPENEPKLDEEWDKILSKRKYNVLVSFGSVAKSFQMPEIYKKTLLEVFEEMKDVTFIWKYEKPTNIADHLPNVHLSNWMPQVPLLNDPRLNIFITHGGLGSTTEVSYSGKPAIYLPLFADQPRNAEMTARYGGAKRLVKTDLQDKDLLIKSIREMLEDKSYTENAEKLGKILRSVPLDPTETFIKHVEFAGRVGRIPNLNSYARNLTYVQYFFIDVIAFVLLLVTLTVVLLVAIVKKVLKLIVGGKAKTD